MQLFIKNMVCQRCILAVKSEAEKLGIRNADISLGQMKTLLFLATFLIPLLGFSNVQKAEFKVYGACGMCETRIEKTAKSVDGVTSADWNRENKMLTLEYDSDKVNVDDVHKKIAKAGHDTDKA